MLICCNHDPDQYIYPENCGTLMFPDYSSITVPVNIAPLNFSVNQPAKKYRIRFESEHYNFVIRSGKPGIFIPPKKWRRLLKKNGEGQYQMIIKARLADGKWKTFEPITNYVSGTEIEPFITYRRINPGMIYWDKMDIVQRSLEDGSENTLISNQNTKYNCINCHTFQNRNPETFLLHLRKAPGGTIIRTDDKNLWLNTKTPFTLSSFVYPSWHPYESIIAFSTNKIHQNFFGTGNRLNHVRDEASDIVIYDYEKNLVYTDPAIATSNFENLPAWSPKGDFIYYISSDHKYKYEPDSMEMYDLYRIAINTREQTFGQPELLISSDSIHHSISWPQVSPDGNYLVFCVTDYGYFTINDPSSNLYLMNLKDFSYQELNVNSDMTESFPSWSGNSHWLMFTSKRLDGRFTTPCFSYIDSAGVAHKPFVIPMKDPRNFMTRLTNMNRPVFVSGKINLTQNKLLSIVNSETSGVVFDSIHVDVDAIAGATVENIVTPQTAAPYMKD
jgi:hypothetical protein